MKRKFDYSRQFADCNWFFDFKQFRLIKRFVLFLNADRTSELKIDYRENSSKYFLHCTCRHFNVQDRGTAGNEADKILTLLYCIRVQQDIDTGGHDEK